MGSLIPGQALIYERVDGQVFARYRDPPYNTMPRWLVGGEAKTKPEYTLWKSILAEAETNKVLRDALDRVIIVYELSKKDSNG